MSWYTNWKRRRVLRRRSLNPQYWQNALATLPGARYFTANELQRLAELVTLFLEEKRFEPAGGMRIGDLHRYVIATHACLLILKLDLDWYDDWTSIIVYPGSFVVNHQYQDEFGIVHTLNEARDGEAWERGPVIIAWDAVAAGYPVLLHEFAHKLDARNGAVNGMPPLHAGMSAEKWARVFTEAYHHFCVCVDNNQPLPFDAYAAQAPAEFFSIVSEVFFCQPAQLHTAYPEIYGQLMSFFRQDPLNRCGRRPPAAPNHLSGTHL